MYGGNVGLPMIHMVRKGGCDAASYTKESLHWFGEHVYMCKNLV